MSDATKHAGTDDNSNGGPHLADRGDPWFDDGNIILQAEGKQFRVFRGILVASSSVFGDMFTIPQPTDEKLVGGCPVVHLSDTAEDLHHVLKALFDRSYCFVDGEPLGLPIVVAFLRLGRKYEIEQLRSEALQRLTHDYPPTLDRYDNIRTYLISRGDIDLDLFFFTIINLARKYDILSILPIAFLGLCLYCYDIKGMVDAFEKYDQSPHSLSLPDQRVLLKGYSSLTNKLIKTQYTLGWLKDYTHQECSNSRRQIAMKYLPPQPAHMALAEWENWKEHMKYHLCRVCISKAEEQHNEGRREVWNELPSDFGLPEWGELVKGL